MVAPLEERLLVVSWNFPPNRGGIEEMVWRLSTRLRSIAEVEVLTGRARRPRRDEPFVVRCPLPGLAGFLLWLMVRIPRTIASRRRPRWILSSGALVGSFTEVLAGLAGLPHAALVYGTDVTYPSAIYQFFLRRLLPRIPKLLSISSVVDGELLRRGLTDRDRIARLPPGVDESIVDQPVDPEVGPPEAPVLLFVGRVIERKGLEPFVVECLPLVLAQLDVRLWIVGEEAGASLAHRPGALASLRRRVAEQGLEDVVTFFGGAEDATLRAAYRAASLLVLPAIEVEGDVEGFGIVFLEAAMFGVPSVSTRTGGIPDAVEDGVGGRLVPPGDWSAFASAIVEILKDPAERDRLGAGAGERARREFLWKDLAVRCLDQMRESHRE